MRKEKLWLTTDLWGRRITKRNQNSDFCDSLPDQKLLNRDSMEEALRKLNLTYKIVGGLSFYQRKGNQRPHGITMRFCGQSMDRGKAFQCGIIQLSKTWNWKPRWISYWWRITIHDTPLWQGWQMDQASWRFRAGVWLMDFCHHYQKPSKSKSNAKMLWGRPII